MPQGEVKELNINIVGYRLEDILIDLEDAVKNIKRGSTKGNWLGITDGEYELRDTYK